MTDRQARVVRHEQRVADLLKLGRADRAELVLRQVRCQVNAMTMGRGIHDCMADITAWTDCWTVANTTQVMQAEEVA